MTDNVLISETIVIKYTEMDKAAKDVAMDVETLEEDLAKMTLSEEEEEKKKSDEARKKAVEKENASEHQISKNIRKKKKRNKSKRYIIAYCIIVQV